MGHIAEALRRANGAPTEAANAANEQDRSPWRFEEGRGDPSGAARTDAWQPLAETWAHSHVGGGPSAADGGFDASEADRLVVSKGAGPLLIEQFRSLAATLQRAQRERPLRSLIVTSTAPGDGKSHVAVNLSLTLSESYRRRVLLVDADLRRPSLHRLFRVADGPGLSNALKTTADQEIAVVPISDTLTLLPAGPPDSSPLGGLSSDRMKRIVENATSRFDWVIVDSPPVGVLADARVVAETLDAAILVVRAGVTRFEDVEAAVDALGEERILGIVLNAVDPAEIRSRDYYGHYYGHQSHDERC